MLTLDSVESAVREKEALMLYFSAPTCNVCHALKPKLVEAFETHFDRIEMIAIDISETPEIASQFSVFTIPTLLVFLDGKEFLRKSRHMSVQEIVDTIRRPYDMMFS